MMTGAAGGGRSPGTAGTAALQGNSGQRMFELMIGVAAAVAFPVAAIMVQQGRERRRNRKAGRRRNDKIRL